MIKKLILKYLGLTNFDEYLQKSEKRLTTIEMDMDNLEDRLKDLEDSEWTDYSVEDFVSSTDYNQAIDEMDTKIQELQDKEILDYESDDFVDYKEFEHTWPKDKKTPVFMVRCLKCSNYRGWINKQYAQQWKEGLVGMEVIHKILN